MTNILKYIANIAVKNGIDESDKSSLAEHLSAISKIFTGNNIKLPAVETAHATYHFSESDELMNKNGSLNINHLVKSRMAENVCKAVQDAGYISTSDAKDVFTGRPIITASLTVIKE